MNIDKAKKFYKTMFFIRKFEQKSAQLYTKEYIRGFMHLYIGEEAVATGVMDALDEDDTILSTYREHGHALARGISANSIMAEMFGKQEGCSKGRGGSMHLFDSSTRFYGGSAIVGGGLPMAVGMAMADKMQNKNRVTVVIFGDGAVGEGEFHESLNLAALWNLPILFVCENNKYGMGTALELSESQTDISKKAASYKIKSSQVDGMDVVKVNELTSEAVEYIKNGKGPFFIEALTYRFKAHSMFDAQLYRTKDEVNLWKQKDPLVLFEQYLKDKGIWDKIEKDTMEKDIDRTIEDAVEFAKEGTFESVDDLHRFVYSE
ncbi:MAG: pyruvate dehydrogenase (acetyl-transferring) E1 component subunit alpha [Campylobacterota bacterium]|nr:pyruvate dehydrogenase (acetyl-transferring) E1 component subunit alpha [Campylobacterota bacterium]